MNALQGYGRFIIPVLLVAAVAAWLLTPSVRAKPVHGSCLVDADCLSSERCLVIPAADGFATAGECVDPCEDDLQCPAQQACERFGNAGSYLSPTAANPGSAGACRPKRR